MAAASAAAAGLLACLCQPAVLATALLCMTATAIAALCSRRLAFAGAHLRFAACFAGLSSVVGSWTLPLAFKTRQVGGYC